MDDRSQILGALKPASSKAKAHKDGQASSSSSIGSGNATVKELWELFTARFDALGGRIGDMSLLESELARPHLLDAESGVWLKLPRGNCPVWDAEVGVTFADLAVAETGSLLIASGPGKPRLLSLTPVHHIVLIPEDRIVETLDEAFSQLGDRTTVMITGPSRTADIEGILVRGIHGPGDVTVIPV